MIKGFFFDLDGTLVDTHQANFEAYKRALQDFDVNITFEQFKRTIGMQARDFLPLLAPNLDVLYFDQIAEKKAQYYKELAHMTILNERLVAFLGTINTQHVTALITTAKQRNATVILEHHNLKQYFDIVVTANDVSHSKPHPEPYLLGLKKTGLQPSEVIAFEDSVSGMQAAEAARIAVVPIEGFAA